MSDLDRLVPYMPDIRLRLHLERLSPDEAYITSVRITDRDMLGSLLSAYRHTRRHVETRLSNPFSRPMTVADIADRLDAFTPANRAAFLAYVDEIVQTAAEPEWELPAYSLGNGRLFLLDGNHRAVATYLSGVPVNLKLLVLHAPVDRRILVALKYWDGGLRRFWRRLQRSRRSATVPVS